MMCAMPCESCVFMDGCFVNRGWEEVDLISCQHYPHCTNLLDWQDSMCEHVGMDGWVSLVTVCLRLLQEGTHTASHEGCWCGVVGGQLDGLW